MKSTIHRDINPTCSSNETSDTADLRLNHQLHVTYGCHNVGDGRIHLFQVLHRLLVLALCLQLNMQHSLAAVVCRKHNPSQLLVIVSSIKVVQPRCIKMFRETNLAQNSFNSI